MDPVGPSVSKFFERGGKIHQVVVNLIKKGSKNLLIFEASAASMISYNFSFLVWWNFTNLLVKNRHKCKSKFRDGASPKL